MPTNETNSENQEEKTPLIDVVIKSLRANLILYKPRDWRTPPDMLLATPKIGENEVDCIVVANENSGIIVAEYPLGEPVKAPVIDEVMGFIDGVNVDGGLGHLFIEPFSGLPMFKDGLNTAYISDTDRCIGAFIKETGEIASTYFPYLQSIMDGKATAETELKLLETMSSFSNMQGRLH
jgi:hypothetical protein